MISAERFSQIAGSYWSAQLPRLSHFVRTSNTTARQYAEPVAMQSSHDRHAVVTETAFVMWKAEISGDAVDPAEAFAEASRRLSVVWDQADFSPSIEPQEANDATALLGNIRRLITFTGLQDVVVEPPLLGCGVVSGGTPDFQGRLWKADQERLVVGELKTVDRNFRSVDYRQVVAYVVLQYAATSEVFDFLWLANPLRGTLVSIDVDSFFWLTRSQSSDEACAEIAYDWAAPGVSP